MDKFSGLNALIIEDDEISIEILQQLLSKVNINARALQLNQHNLHLLEEETVDMVFLDLEMPYLNGYEVLSHMKQHPNFQEAYFIAYSTHTSHLTDARKAGFDSFLGKPVDHRNFANQLQRILNGENLWIVP